MTIKAQELLKIYNDRTVVNHISFDIKPAEVVGLLGPNGAGKTTTFYMLVGLVKPDKGKIFLDGNELTNSPIYMRARAGIGYLPQETSIFRKLTVEENISLILEMNKKLNNKERKEKLDSLLEEFGLTKIRKSESVLLSGGERRRVEIARALAADPKFILLDEPFTGIDPIAILDIQENIKQLVKRGIGVLLTDHNPKATLSITDRAYIIFEGGIKVQGTSKEVSEDPIARQYYLGENFEL
ncbi:MAG: LPS export ABC transporter ATP-binding protein [Candidatus Melainabacteria bacterium GWF2_37_15]|nr:MAG: LPS export ABC transporter ATP-binding protein [Candidatus Melainabacteria bacterium GWF2_37_15]